MTNNYASSYRNGTQPAGDTDRRRYRKISQGEKYETYVFAYAARQGVGWYLFGAAITYIIILFDVRLSGRDVYGPALRVFAPLVSGLITGIPVYGMALMFRRQQYDIWAQHVVEVESENGTAPRPQEKLRAFVTTNDEPTAKTIQVGKYRLDPDKMGEWADVLFERSDGRIVRDDIPGGIFDNITAQWRAREIQGELIRLGWAEWENEAAGHLRLTANGEAKFAEF